MEAELAQTKENQNKRREQEIYRELENNVDNDQTLGILVGENDARRQLAYDHLKREVRSQVGQRGMPYGPETVEAAMQKTRAFLNDLGVSGEAAGRTGTQPPKGGAGGLGPAPGISPQLQAEKPPERVPSTDPNYNDNVLKRALAKQAEEGSE